MIRVEPVTSLDLRCSGGGWSFEHTHREAIARHWDGVIAANPRLWNGRTLICTGAEVKAGVFRAELAEIDYASFVASVVNCFGVPAVFSADGALLIGVMGPTTLNAGKAYPPSGSLEPRDVRPDGSIDILGNMRTELLEETGLDLAEATPGAMAAIFDMVRAINQALERGRLPEGQLQEVRLGLAGLLDMLGLAGLAEAGSDSDVPAEVLDLLRRREDARAARDFAEADALRDAIAAQGFEVRDGPDGAEVVPAS